MGFLDRLVGRAGGSFPGVGPRFEPIHPPAREPLSTPVDAGQDSVVEMPGPPASRAPLEASADVYHQRAPDTEAGHPTVVAPKEAPSAAVAAPRVVLPGTKPSDRTPKTIRSAEALPAAAPVTAQPAVPAEPTGVDGSVDTKPPFVSPLGSGAAAMHSETDVTLPPDLTARPRLLEPTPAPEPQPSEVSTIDRPAAAAVPAHLAPPDVHITIGRIEVMASDPLQQRVEPREPALSLTDYLQERAGT